MQMNQCLTWVSFAFVEVCPVDEQRYINLGSSDKGRVLVVVYTERGSKIRIISCRKSTLSERKLYEEGGE